jgi:Leucine-rich repeat (LRR) protein
LEILDLGYNRIRFIPKLILPKLEELFLGKNLHLRNVQNLVSTSELTNLDFLSINYNRSVASTLQKLESWRVEVETDEAESASEEEENKVIFTWGGGRV